jgi:hypothetical protein
MADAIWFAISRMRTTSGAPSKMLPLCRKHPSSMAACCCLGAEPELLACQFWTEAEARAQGMPINCCS